MTRLALKPVVGASGCHARVTITVPVLDVFVSPVQRNLLPRQKAAWMGRMSERSLNLHQSLIIQGVAAELAVFYTLVDGDLLTKLRTS